MKAHTLVGECDGIEVGTQLGNDVGKALELVLGEEVDVGAMLGNNDGVIVGEILGAIDDAAIEGAYDGAALGIQLG